MTEYWVIAAKTEYSIFNFHIYRKLSNISNKIIFFNLQLVLMFRIYKSLFNFFNVRFLTYDNWVTHIYINYKYTTSSIFTKTP